MLENTTTIKLIYICGNFKKINLVFTEHFPPFQVPPFNNGFFTLGLSLGVSDCIVNVFAPLRYVIHSELNAKIYQVFISYCMTLLHEVKLRINVLMDGIFVIASNNKPNFKQKLSEC